MNYLCMMPRGGMQPTRSSLETPALQTRKWKGTETLRKVLFVLWPSVFTTNGQDTWHWITQPVLTFKNLRKESAAARFPLMQNQAGGSVFMACFRMRILAWTGITTGQMAAFL